MTLELKELSLEQVKQIKELEIRCRREEHLKSEVFLSSSLNAVPQMPCFFLLYEGEKLISFLSVFFPQMEEGEISAYTQPEYRRKGYFKKLLALAVRHLSFYGIPRLLFVAEPNGVAAQAVLKRLGASYSHSEFVMKHNGSRPGPVNSVLKLHEIHGEGLAVLVDVTARVFEEEPQKQAPLVEKAVNAPGISAYMAVLDSIPVGVVNVNRETENASIFGLGILPDYRHQRLGADMLRLVVEKLLEEGTRPITLEVGSNNNYAYRLYISNGFEILSQVDYYLLVSGS